MSNFFKLFFSKSFEGKFNEELDKVLVEKDSVEEYIQELTENYATMIKSIAPDYQKIMIDRTDFKKIKIDGKIYDLDCGISRRQPKLLECLSAIDALFADLLADGMELEDCINQTEAKLNQMKRN
ncbi:MAG: hypothetical protein IJ489_00570 [Clostridia bacterium]|nr:hypothetical protein [Clostridia bacterium]